MTLRAAESKRSVLAELLREGMVLIALDARQPQVVVPAHLHRDLQLRLNLSYRFGLPLQLDDWGVRATLTFGGCGFACAVPWSAIFLLVSHVDGQPYLFVEDIPAELLAPGLPPAPAAAASWAPRAHLVVEPDDGHAPDASFDADTDGPPGHLAAAQKPQLTLVSAPAPQARVQAAQRGASCPPGRVGGRHLRLVK